MQTIIVQTYYIATGRKNAMYTLRACREYIGQPPYMADIMPDFYVLTLAATEEKAIEKAAEYVEAFRARVGETETYRIVFDDVPHAENYKRIGRLSVSDSQKVECIQSGVIPFGKYQGQKFDDVQPSYILYWVDKSREEITEPVIAAIIAKCQGVAVERGLIEARNAAREARRASDAKSSYVGTIGKRQEFTGVLEYVSGPREGVYGDWHVNKIRVGDDILVYFGKPLGEQGVTLKIRATVDRHSEYEGAKTTQIKRPA